MFRKGKQDEADRLYEIWHGAVKATHNFLSDEQFDEIALIVKNDFLPNVIPEVYVDDHDIPLGFMTMTNNTIDALFIDLEHRGKGIGKAFVHRVKNSHDSLKLEVNEQNPSAHGFYIKMGFVDVLRTEVDQAGRPFPLIYMQWSN